MASAAVPPGSGVTLLLSDDVASPVTFGWRDPVVPAACELVLEELPETMQDAILCHELLHVVSRRDWLFTIAEENGTRGAVVSSRPSGG